MFKTNESTTDRIIRAIVGVAALVVFFLNQGTTLGWIALVVAALALFTAAVGWCALYSVFGINTCKVKS
ncbi:DUF2892 domain-containing protein [uncultured Maritimibacter sp.]|jgi:uncharacterized membrane protein YccC|uniref:YgaP family membrane protein n=1 Tax=uncultured Maritimibacter sp. TaxID=991866 RepID=UPI00261CD344|nr:DUF2892 domain-containing protein [uncultured Maritimibacter sp.]